MKELQVPAILAAIAGAVLVSWVLNRLRPTMPLHRRAVYILGGGILAGGALYGMILGH